MSTMHRSAVLSDCGQFRYILRRSWDTSRPALGFVMLNPSVADGDVDDPTIRKCIGFAKRLGYGAINVTNLFAHRATDPAELRRAAYPQGVECDWWIAQASRQSEVTVCAWGSNARGLVRPFEVIEILRMHRAKVRALAFTDDGIPRHPLMLSYKNTLQELPA